MGVLPPHAWLSHGMLVCAGDASRNRTVGLRLGKGEKLEDIIKSTNAVAEGVLTSKWVPSLQPLSPY